MNNAASSLRNSSLLCAVHVKAYTGAKLDKKVTREVQNAHNASESSGAYRKRLLPKDALSEVNAAVSAIREYFHAETLPWTNDGQRVLPAKNHTKFMARMTELGENYWAAVGQFIENYNSYVKEARNTLGSMHDPNDYPDLEKLKMKYDFTVETDSMPNIEDFRVQMSDRERNMLEKHIEQRLEHAQKIAQADLWKRLLKVVGHMSEKLQDESKPIFRDTLVGNIGKVIEMVPSLNVTGSKEIADMAARIKAELLAVSPEILRKNEAVKSDVARKAEKIFDDMSMLLAPEETMDFRKAA